MTNDTDKRSVHTDALETLGHKISSNEGRDAIHLAVEPIQAAEKLYPGQDIGLKYSTTDGTTYVATASPQGNKIGIVDPFLKEPVYAGDWFWLVIYPREITSLRHVWQHPAFYPAQPMEQEDNIGTQVPYLTKKSVNINESIHWMDSYAYEINVSYTELMTAAKRYIETGDYFILGNKFEGVTIHRDFWRHYENITGNTGTGDFFSCSC